MALHSSHRILMRLGRSHPFIDIHKRIIRYHALVHPIEGKCRTVGRPECSLTYPKLVLMHRSTTNNTRLILIRYILYRSIGQKHLQILPFGKRKAMVCGAEIIVFSCLRHSVVCHNPGLFQIVMEGMPFMTESQYRFIFIWNRKLRQAGKRIQPHLLQLFVQRRAAYTYLRIMVRLCPGISILTFHLQIHIVAHPDNRFILRLELRVVLASGYQILQRQVFLLSHYTQRE